MRNPTLADGDRRQPAMPAVLDRAGRARQRVLALFLPIAAALYISAEALNPHGTDQPITTRAVALKELPIAVHHPSQLYVSGSLTLLALGGPGRLLRGDRHPGQEPWFGPRDRRRADRGNWRLLRSPHQRPGRVQPRRRCDGSHVPGRGCAVPCHHLRLPGLPGVRRHLLHRHLRRAGAYGVRPVAEPERAALAGGPVLRRPGTRPAAWGRSARSVSSVLTLPFAVAMVLLAARIWRAAAPPASRIPEPVAVPVSNP